MSSFFPRLSIGSFAVVPVHVHASLPESVPVPDFGKYVNVSVYGYVNENVNGYTDAPQACRRMSSQVSLIP